MKNLSMIPRMQRLFAAVLLFSLIAATGFAQSVWSGNGHTYEAVYAPGLTWAQAQAACEARGGYLATITSAGENDFIKSLFENNSAFWYFDGANALGPWIGGIQASGSSEPGGGWGWFNGEPFSYTDWSSHDPDNCCGLNQNRIIFIRDGNVPPTRWTDVEDFAGFVRGYILESSPSTTTCVPAPSGLVSWWPGENDANDIQGSNHGTLQNGATFASGKVGQAISFDGVNDFIRIEDNSNLRLGTGEMTIDAWVIASPSNTFRAIAAKVGLSFPFPGYALRVTDDNKVEFFAVDCATGSCGFSLPGGSGSRQPVRSTSVVADNNFHHVTGVRRSDGTLEIYVDGVLENTRLEPLRNTDSADPFTIAEINAGGPEQPFNGIIDEVDIYNRALSTSEIQSIYNAGSAGKCANTPPPVCVNPPSGLVSWWPGDDNANDIQSSNHGALQNGATFATGKVGQTFSFDGVDDAVLIADNASLQVSSFTLDAWINTANATLIQPIMAKVQTSENWISYMLRIQDGGKLALIVENRAENRYAHWRTLSTLASNRWYHVAGTWQNLNGDYTDAKIYVDGVEQAIEMSLNNGYGSNFLPGYTSEPFYIGRDGQPSGRFVGLIDEVDIYDRVLSAAEIQSIYNAGSAGKCKECTPHEVNITGNESICPNSPHVYAATTNAINPSFNWSVTGGTINGSNTGSSINVTAGSVGTMTVIVEVAGGTTNCNNSAALEVLVEDHEPPVLRTFPAHHSLWPPNHQYETFLVAHCVDTVGDNCTFLSPSDVVVAFVTSDEPEDAKGNGDGNTRNDIVIASDCKSVQLRSERQGGGNGRVYTLHLSVRDGNGNTGTATCLVTVPKSQNGNPAVDDGPIYTVTGSCNGSLGKLAGVSSDENAETMTLPESYALEQNYPNPFNPSTVIGFQLPENSDVKLTIYSVTGQLVRELVNGKMNAGRHVFSWDGRDRSGNTVGAGMYLYRLVARGANGEVMFAQTRRMAFVK